MESNKNKKKAVSAGGVIVKKSDNNTYSILLLRDTRFPEWYMAKGHVESDETLQQTALREIKEEAGLQHIEIHELLGTYDRFVEKANEFKTIHYFLASPTQEETPLPPENKYAELKWWPLEKLPIMFLSEQQDVVEKNIDKIKNSLSINV